MAIVIALFVVGAWVWNIFECTSIYPPIIHEDEKEVIDRHYDGVI
jgi:hypothetical protein